MKPYRFVRYKLRRQHRAGLQNMRRDRDRQRLRDRHTGPAEEITRTDWAASVADPTAFYFRCCHYFDRNLPDGLRAHRSYFTQQGRGFGEDAFHTMWFLLFREFRPESFLEIGVFRGQSLSLAAWLARHFRLDCHIQGISPFSTAGDRVSRYRGGLDYQTDTLQNFAHFQLPAPALLKAYSTDDASRKLVASRTWSIIYIDGNHDYEIAKQDWELCARHIAPGGLIVLDDAGLSTNFRPPAFYSTGGHPGPSRLAPEISSTEFQEILQVGHNRVFQKIAR
jgi:hypothetical protein